MGIHPTAIVDPAARIGNNVAVGPYAVIGAQVEIGDDCDIASHVVISGPTRIGAGTRIHAHAAIGGDPQDKKYHGERSELVIGQRNTIREFCTINRGTGDGGGSTRIGDDNWIMAYVHIAHDCIVGNQTVFANNATLAGHVHIGDFAILGGFSGIHQFCRIGEHAFIGMGSLVNADVPPFVMVAGNYAKPRGINSEGLRRRGFDAERIAAIKRAYRALYVSGKPQAQTREQLALEHADAADVLQMLDFIARSERSLLR
ncbi:MAG: acyl-ACP--UDP-N-acetylglucosamine O-acyltransferase [Proteobacteria bacterium]|nr:acyl-ACP--UDP-N-acetylglucosamine O-acyltransferase [Pseudomonadota bacterium]MBS0465528.1 acyl-ACP--UDP-N-acetylglucosamine O-acyltransferase [Pseudomonadota bacterium]